MPIPRQSGEVRKKIIDGVIYTAIGWFSNKRDAQNEAKYLRGSRIKFSKVSARIIKDKEKYYVFFRRANKE